VLEDKIVVITGGAGLIGQEFVKTVAKNQGVAIIADIDKQKAEVIEKKLKNILKCECIDSVKLDITSKKSLDEVILYVDKKYGRIDALVNNAYPRNNNYGKHFFDVEYNDFIENVGMNVGGYFITSQIFSKYFQNQGYGNIINISSIYGVIPPKFEIYDKTSMTTPVEYAACKSALIHLTKYMARYFKGLNIRVNTISPGGVQDGQEEAFLKAYNLQCSTIGMLNKDDLNGSLLYLLSDLSKYVNGQNIIVDDGFSL
jgi:NAD(P)-dependent dehydrogenase (short-subunit alcohol dehydrogenase family)